MSFVDLTDEETVAILSETFVESFASLDDYTRKLSVLKRIHELLECNAPQHYVYEAIEGCEELQVIRAGDDLRVFCRLVMGVPQNDEHYNVLFVFDVDPHQYRPERLTTFDDVARRRLREATSFDGIADVNEYLEEMDAFTAAEIEARIARLGG